MSPGGAGVAVQKIEWLSRPLSKHQLFIVGIFLFAVIAHLPYLFPGGPTACHSKPLFFSIDEGTVLYDSFRITCGEVMYRDFFEFQGPVFYHIYAGLFALTGPSLTAARALNLLITALTATVYCITGRSGPWKGSRCCGSRSPCMLAGSDVSFRISPVVGRDFCICRHLSACDEVWPPMLGDGFRNMSRTMCPHYPVTRAVHPGYMHNCFSCPGTCAASMERSLDPSIAPFCGSLAWHSSLRHLFGN